MKVVGRDATLLRGRDGTDTSFLADTIEIGPGEAADVIITMPASSGGTVPPSGPAYDAYPLFDRNYADGYLTTAGDHAGLRTEVRAYPPGTLSPQTTPNA